MRIFILDGNLMTDRETAYDYLDRVIRFPEYFGHNLDALSDCLTELDDDTIIIVQNSHALEENMGEYGKRMLNVMKDASEAGFVLIEK